MTKAQAIRLVRDCMMMEFEETAVTGCIVRRSPAKAPAARKPATSRPRRRSAAA